MPPTAGSGPAVSTAPSLSALSDPSCAAPGSTPTHRLLPSPAGRIHLVEQGSGPLVLLLHGFPESWYAWRHQMAALASAGYRAVAIDVRGYGRSSKPEAVEAYRMLDLIADNVAVVEGLGERSAVVVGHDWGATIAAMSTLTRPDVFRAVGLLGVPYTPPGGPRPSEVFARMGGTGADGTGADGAGSEGAGSDGPGADGPGARGAAADGPGADEAGADALGPGALGADVPGPGALGADAPGPGALGTDAPGPGGLGTDDPGAGAGPGAGRPGAGSPGVRPHPGPRPPEFYISYFQQPGRAEAEIEPDVRGWLAGFYAALSADTMPAPGAPDPHFTGAGGTLRERFPVGVLPSWLGERDLDVYAGEFERTGMTGALNRYRNMDRDWADLAAWAGRPITRPSLFIGGERDASLAWLADAVKAYPETLPGLLGSHILDGCGHFVQQERPEETNRILLDWLASLPA